MISVWLPLRLLRLSWLSIGLMSHCDVILFQLREPVMFTFPKDVIGCVPGLYRFFRAAIGKGIANWVCEKGTRSTDHYR
jgi:hypothetical protein